MSGEVMRTGKIIALFKKEKVNFHSCFGFINDCETKQDIIFFSIDCVSPEFKKLKRGMMINYSLIIEAGKRPRAINIIAE